MSGLSGETVTVDVRLSAYDLDRIIEWFIAAHRDMRGSCGPEANHLVARLTAAQRELLAVIGSNVDSDA